MGLRSVYTDFPLILRITLRLELLSVWLQTCEFVYPGNSVPDDLFVPVSVVLDSSKVWQLVNKIVPYYIYELML